MKKLHVPLLVLAGIFLFLFIMLIPFVHNNLARIIIIQSASSENVKIKNFSIRLGTQKIKIKNLNIVAFDSSIEIPALDIKYSLSNLIFKRKTLYKSVINEIKINSDTLILSANFDGKYNSRLKKLYFSPSITAKSIKKIQGADITELSLKSDIVSSNKTLGFYNTDFRINDGKLLSNIEVNFQKNKLKDIDIKCELNSLPFSLYKVLLHPENGVYKFFEESIKDGGLDSGKVEIKIPAEYIDFVSKASSKEIAERSIEEYVKANLKVKNLHYKYSPFMPDVKARSVDLTVNGSLTRIFLKGAFLNGTNVTDGRVKFDYLAENFEVIADATAIGTVQDLVSFVDPEELNKMAESNLSLANLNGIAETKIHLVIPVVENKKSIYDIKSKITNCNGKLFKDRVDLTSFVINGVFDGEKVTLAGNGKINDFNSNLSLLVNLDEKEEISNRVIAKINLEKSDKEVAGIKFLDGSSTLVVDFLTKNKVTSLTATADLAKLHFLIPAISLDKGLEKSAKFKLYGVVNEGVRQKFSLNLLGEDSLSIKGVINTDDQLTKLTFSEVKYLNNNFKAEVITGGKQLLASVSGGLLDLSQADFSKFQQKEEESNIESLKLNVHLDLVKLKNNVTLIDTMIDAECKNEHCPIVRFNASMGKNILRVDYENSAKPKWKLETNNAGMLIAGLGLSNKMKNGKLTLEIDAPITKYKNPEHFANARFVLYNFDAGQNNILTKMMSFISLPGLIGALTKSDIHFDIIKGEVKIQNGQYYLSNVTADGPYFNFLAKGRVDTNERKIDIKGQVVPSLYGVNKLLGTLPLIKIFVGNRSGLVVTPFFIKDKY